MKKFRITFKTEKNEIGIFDLSACATWDAETIFKIEYPQYRIILTAEIADTSDFPEMKRTFKYKKSSTIKADDLNL